MAIFSNCCCVALAQCSEAESTGCNKAQVEITLTNLANSDAGVDFSGAYICVFEEFYQFNSGGNAESCFAARINTTWMLIITINEDETRVVVKNKNGEFYSIYKAGNYCSTGTTLSSSDGILNKGYGGTTSGSATFTTSGVTGTSPCASFVNDYILSSGVVHYASFYDDCDCTSAVELGGVTWTRYELLEDIVLHGDPASCTWSGTGSTNITDSDATDSDVDIGWYVKRCRLQTLTDCGVAFVPYWYLFTIIQTPFHVKLNTTDDWNNPAGNYSLYSTDCLRHQYIDAESFDLSGSSGNLTIIPHPHNMDVSIPSGTWLKSDLFGYTCASTLAACRGACLTETCEVGCLDTFDDCVIDYDTCVACNATCLGDYNTCFTACAGDPVCEAACAVTYDSCLTTCCASQDCDICHPCSTDYDACIEACPCTSGCESDFIDCFVDATTCTGAADYWEKYEAQALITLYHQGLGVYIGSGSTRYTNSDGVDDTASKTWRIDTVSVGGDWRINVDSTGPYLTATKAASDTPVGVYTGANTCTDDGSGLIFFKTTASVTASEV